MSARLLKVIVQPVYVADQDGELVEAPVQPVTLTAAEWKALNPEVWAKEGAVAVDAQLSPSVEAASP
jgi:hypothetical protein